MQAYSLRPGVHYCTTDEVTIFLDVDADRFFGLPSRCQPAFSNLVANGQVPTSQTTELTPLLAGQLLVPTHEWRTFPSPATAPLARYSALDLSDEANSLWHFLAAWHCQTQARRALSRDPLSQTLAKLRARKETSAKSAAPNEVLLSSFLTTSAVTSTRDQCLRRSVAMVNFLARHQSYPLFVIGVKTQPFAAHAWVQFEDMVLNDEVEQVSRFTPILVI